MTFKNYWTQLTPENSGKYGSVAISSDTIFMELEWFGCCHIIIQLTNHLIFKEHCLIWGAQQPSWLSGMDSSATSKRN